jgi:Arc/MetJ family transcription regulator
MSGGWWTSSDVIWAIRVSGRATATLRLTGLKTKREAVELGLRTIVRLPKQEHIRRFRGKLPWQGDLDATRTD